MVTDTLKTRLLSAVRTRKERDELVALLEEIAPQAEAANVEKLEMTADGTYDDAQLQAVADKVDEIIDALVAAGLMEEAE